MATSSVVSDGVTAMEYLRKQGQYADAPTPDLVLLDLNLPRMDGREVLQALKQDDELRRIPVVVLTTSVILPMVQAAGIDLLWFGIFVHHLSVLVAHSGLALLRLCGFPLLC